MHEGSVKRFQPGVWVVRAGEGEAGGIGIRDQELGPRVARPFHVAFFGYR